MSYEVIARRWRPKAFEAVVGQRHVTETLKNAIASDRLAHALLFTGPRGVGKTTTARIVAKALNCAQGPSPAPCGACPTCEEIAAGRSLDCIEVDAASNTQVEKTRDLLETVQYAPGRGRHKIYIIDEAHMLSMSSFNALLKTLEEPPPRVIFILATTEPHRIPATIHSRCQRHDFRLLGVAEIGERLAEIAAAEGATADEGTVALLSQAAAGSLRDAQSLLDQAIACLGTTLSADRVADLLGLVRAEVLAEAADAILAREVGRALSLVDRLAGHGQDLRQFTLELCAHLRDLMVVKACAAPGPLLETARVPLETCRAQAERTSLAELEVMIRTLQRAENEMRRATQPRLLLELALLRLAEVRHLTDLRSILDRLATMEGRLGEGESAGAPPQAELPLFGAAAPPRRAESPPPPPRPAGKPLAMAKEADAPTAPPPTPPTAAVPTEGLAGGWASAIESLRSRKRLASVLAEVKPVAIEGDRLILEVPNGNAFVRDTLEDVETRRALGEAASATYGGRIRVEYRFTAADPALGSAPALAGRGPAPLQDHPLVREALILFGGSVVRASAG
jgi:DNA polymerase-3 subunit gamma/tau